jgi:UDP-N-acetylmuramoyl-tripeptide--D-alanyl-D-alanine ligase
VREWDARRIAEAAGASLLSPGEATARSGEAGSGPSGVSIDSRSVAPGDLFVGLPGERVDGGAYAARALAAGAWGALVAPAHAGALPAEANGVVLTHEDPLVALQALARAWLAELRAGGARVVAITGSTGKTSTKDILAALLARHLSTAASPANHNTEIGLPLAILAAPRGTRALVLEMAMRGQGQIGELTEIARPEVGVIVNVGPVHLELLGTVEAIAAAKAELIAGLEPGATMIVPAGEPLLRQHLREDVHTVTFGPGGDVQLAERGEDGTVAIADGAFAAAAREPARIGLRPSFAQEHNLRNLIAAVAAARALGVTPGGEVSVRFSELRGQREDLPGGMTLIEDCYNANPMSMRAALDDLARTASGRRVAVLGDMLELGPEEGRYHREIGAYARANGVDVLVTVGPRAAAMRDTFAGPGGRVHAAPDADAAAKLLDEALERGDTVLVKGSRGVRLERVGETLRRARDRADEAEVPTRAGGR